MLKTSSKRVIQKRAEATGDLIGNKTPNKITRASNTSPKSNLELNEEKILREKYISRTLGQKINEDVRL